MLKSGPMIHRPHPISPTLGIAWRFAVKDFAARYRSSLLGLGWYVVMPVILIGVYSAVFFYIFEPKTGTAKRPDSLMFYAASLWIGLMMFLSFSDLCVKSSRVIIDQANLVRKVVFPVSSLVIAGWLVMIFNLAIYGVLLAAILLMGGVVISPGSLVALPILAIFLITCLGLAFLIAAIGAYIRDLAHLMPAAVGLLMFLTPIFYQHEHAPALFQKLLMFNPLTWPIESVRKVLLFNELPDPTAALIYLGAACVLLWIGLWVFGRLKKGFADLL